MQDLGLGISTQDKMPAILDGPNTVVLQSKWDEMGLEWVSLDLTETVLMFSDLWKCRF